MALKTLIESAVSGGEPSVGDIIKPHGLPAGLYCGMFKGTWVFATENTSVMDKRPWNIHVIRPVGNLVVERGFDPKTARGLYEYAIEMPIPGSLVEAAGLEALYLRSDDYGLNHRVAFEFTDETVDRLSRMDLDRIVEVDGTHYGITGIISESMRLRRFPDPKDSARVAAIAVAPAKIRTR